MDLMDESGEIRATAFNAECDKFNQLVEVYFVFFILKIYFLTSLFFVVAKQGLLHLSSFFEDSQ